MSQRCPTCGSEEACWNAAEAFGMDDIHLSPYPSQTAMAAAVELEVHAALGQVQTQTIGKVIQNAIDKAIEKYDRNLKDEVKPCPRFSPKMK